MSYIALARKWRPRTFSELLGQTPVTTVLTRSLNQHRLHHAYLFTGTRGVGKTSVARLFAKALNCETGIQADPCLQCETCLAIEQGRFADLIEIDGASKTRVEDTRELLDNIIYAPSIGRFKIYLIDEVHMLSHHSFNALLKTLEEPPEHVKFLLATTDPQKLPLTVLSRCLQLHLKPISSELIEQHLAYILQQEAFTYETQALSLLATAAQGSLRDALSLLDQVIAASEQHVETKQVQHLLGLTEQDYAQQVLDALALGETQTLLTLTQHIAQEGSAFRSVLETLLTHLQTITRAQLIPAYQATVPAALLALAQQWSPEETQLFYQIALQGLTDLALAPSPAMGFEMTLLRMYTFRELPLSVPATAPAILSADQTPKPTTAPPTIVSASPHPPCEPSLSPPEKKEDLKARLDWSDLLPKLKLTGLAASALEQAAFVEKTTDQFILSITKTHRSLYTPAVQTRIEAALKAYYGTPFTLVLQQTDEVFASPAQQKAEHQHQQQQTALLALEEDTFFQQLKHTFKGELVKNSIETVKNDL